MLTVREYANAQTIYDQVLCAVLIAPGYDIVGSLQNTPWLSQQLILSLMKHTFIHNHRRILEEHNGSIIAASDAATDLTAFFETYFGAMSGYESYEEWVRGTNPTETFEFMQCPALVINARDDPIATAQTMDEWKWLFTESDACPNAILCETEFGSHCAFLDLFGGFWLDHVILEYVQTVYSLTSRRNDQHFDKQTIQSDSK